MPDMPNPAFGPATVPTVPTSGAPFGSNYPAPAATKKWPWLVAAVLGGIAAGSAAYRFGFSGLGLSGGTRGTVLLAIMIIAASGASRIVRMNRSEMTPAPIPMVVVMSILGLAFGVGIGVAVAPPLGYQMLTVRQFPGFSIALPSGDESTAPSTYNQGNIDVVHVGGFAGGVSVRWQIGDLPSDSDMEVLAHAIVTGIETSMPSKHSSSSAITPLAFPLEASLLAKSKSVSFVASDFTMYFTVADCGGRMLMVITGSDKSSGAQRLHSRVVESLRCTPDPKQTAATDGLPLVIDLPTWRSADANRGQMLLTSGDGNAMLLVTPLVDDPSHEGFDKVLRAYLSALTDQLKLNVQGTGDMLTITGTVSGQPARGWLHTVACSNSRGWLLLLYVEAGADGAATHRDEIAKARCGEPGEKLPTWSPVTAPTAPTSPAAK